MMKIENIPEKCMGCSACKNICPKNCIEMIEDEEGFPYPKIDYETCIECGLCDKTCQVFSKNEKQDPVEFYCGWHKDESIRKASSSGGVFSAVAQLVLNQNGVVFGSMYDYKLKAAVHSSTEKYELGAFRKSKYVEDYILFSYQDAKKVLEAGRVVLFTGTPCQIVGLKEFLKKDYDNLITCDFICHGVTPNKLLQEHIKTLERKYKSEVELIDFRPKTAGWGHQAIKIKFQNGKQYNNSANLDSYFRGFIAENIYLRKSCYTCSHASNHVADITMADFWHINKYNPKLNDNKGISLIFVNTDKGQNIMKNIENVFYLYPIERKYAEYALREKSYSKDQMQKRSDFYKLVEKLGFEKAAKETYMKSDWKYQLKFKIKLLLFSKRK